MLIGLVGAPNKGKSTLFSAITMVDVDIADYPFTTIKPNYGVCYAAKPCVEKELGVKCKARNSLCKDGIRYIPINVTDVAGIVPGAHMGKGMGNQFLNDLVNADTLIQVIDVTGKTDVNGNACDSCNPADEVRMFKEELTKWIEGIVARHTSDKTFAGSFTNFNIDEAHVENMIRELSLPLSAKEWKGEQISKFAEAILKKSKPIIIAANKSDAASADKLKLLSSKLTTYDVIGCSAAIELALRKASKSGIIDYAPGSSSFEIRKNVSVEQRKALDYAQKYISSNKGTGVQQLINDSVFKIHDMIVVYPVEDENKYTDHFGNVLPDAILMKRGSTLIDLAAKIHTDLAKSMLYGIDAKKKIRISKDYKLQDNDVVKIVSAAK